MNVMQYPTLSPDESSILRKVSLNMYHQHLNDLSSYTTGGGFSILCLAMVLQMPVLS